MRRTPPLGQHFLKNASVARALVGAARIKKGDAVLEIGPGTGMLTRVLCETGARIIAVEKDPVLFQRLRTSFVGEIASGQLILVKNDIRDLDPGGLGLKTGDYIVAANIPYYITGEILRKFLSAKAHPRTMALLVQKEVAERIVARDRKESILSISVKAYGTPTMIAKVSRGNFMPPPSVDSAILLIANISRELFDDVGEERFFRIVRTGFSSKRKLLTKNLEKVLGSHKPEIMHELEHCGIDVKTRAEDVPFAKWKCLARSLAR